MTQDFGPPPNLDVTDPGSLGQFLGRLWEVCVHNHTCTERVEKEVLAAIAKLDQRIGAINDREAAEQQHRDVMAGREIERAEQRDRGEKRLGRWKLRFETVAVLIGVATGGAGLGGLIAALVFG